MELLINGLLHKGAQRKNLQAKVFGASTISGKHANIGASNGKFAIDFLAKESIPCVSQSLGGENARRVKFVPTTGQVQQYLVPIETVREQEISPSKKESDITFF